MPNHFIKNLTFSNFKCFKKININNIKRVNLISGKNNIGKTSLMEGIELFISSSDSLDLSFNIYEMMKRRQSSLRRDRYFELDFIFENSLEVELSINNKKIKIEYTEMMPEKAEDLFHEENLMIEYQPSLKLTVNDDERNFLIERLIHRPPMMRKERYDTIKSKVNFITSTTTDERDIAILYGKLVDLNKEEFLNNSLKLFDENLVALKQKATDRDIVLKVALKNRELPVLLSSLGEGINRYIAILCAIWASKDGYLFIDEIENGIHFTNYSKLWNIVFEVSEMANCQIFITTHSKECIEVFNKVNQENDGSYFEFYRDEKTNFIVTKQKDNEQLEYELTHNIEIRGE
ncbi:MAG TPA: ATP-binding protein [Arcobacter sp.]|nr:ATP-binding protein [Arcobacter sp.]